VELERTVEPSWPKLVEPLEKIVDQLAVVWGLVNHLKSVKDSPELRSAIEEVQVSIFFSIFMLAVPFYFLISTSNLSLKGRGKFFKINFSFSSWVTARNLLRSCILKGSKIT
jgi:hypothetical protein